MTNDKSETPDNAADIAFVKALAEVLRDNDLGELEVERKNKGEARLSVRISRMPKLAPAPAAAAPAPAPAAPAASAAPAPAASAAADEAGISGDPSAIQGAVLSPMVGTVYLSPEPGAPPFVSVGDKVTEGQTVLIIEAMKTMNQIPAPRSGTVRRILVEDGAPVEYGAPLMVID